MNTTRADAESDPATLAPASTPENGGEFESGNRGDLSGRDDVQRRQIGQDDPIAEGSRQGRERYRDAPDRPKDGATGPAV